VIVFVFTGETEIRWVGHALAGIFSLVFSVAAAVLGAMMVGRIRKMQGVNLFRLHRKITIYLALLIVGTFFYGLWDRTSHGEPLFWQHVEPLATVVQGWFGLVVTIITVVQIVPCLAAKDRRKTRKLHMILGYALVLSLVIQTFLGIEAALVESAEVAIFTRSLLQGLRGLATA
jgi:hypothetical protein